MPNGSISGGATKVLRDIAIGLSHRGHQITILTTLRPDSKKVFYLENNVKVVPCLPFKPDFPCAYNIPPFSHMQLIELARYYVNGADIAYLHDSGFLYQDIFKDIPLIVSFRDFIYEETLIGAFQFQRDYIVVNSDYMRDSIYATISKLRPGIMDRVKVIENGIDWNLFKKNEEFSRIQKYFHEKLPIEKPILLYPHRHDLRKGIEIVLESLKILCQRRKDLRPTLFVPANDVDKANNENDKFRIRHLIRDCGIRVVYHDWIPHHLMPIYYTLGDVTLCIGSFVEAFGSNVALESIACETPVIQAMVGAHRNTIPDGYTFRVSPQDPEEVSNAIEAIIKKKQDTLSLFELKKRFSLKNMIDKYESLFMNAKILPPLALSSEITAYKQTHVSLPIWSFWTDKGIYNDYVGSYWNDPRLFQLSDCLIHGNKISINRMTEIGFNLNEINEATFNGYIVFDNGSI